MDVVLDLKVAVTSFIASCCKGQSNNNNMVARALRVHSQRGVKCTGILMNQQSNDYKSRASHILSRYKVHELSL